MSDFEVTVVPGVRVTLTMPEDGTWNGSDGERRFLTLTPENFAGLIHVIEEYRKKQEAWQIGGRNTLVPAVEMHSKEPQTEEYFPGPGEAASTVEVDDFEFLIERLSGDRIVVSTYAPGAIHDEAARAATTLILDNEVLHTLRFRVTGDVKLWLFRVEPSPF